MNFENIPLIVALIKALTKKNSAESQSKSYTDLTDKPKINGVELTGNKSAADLGIVPSGGGGGGAAPIISNGAVIFTIA